MEQLSMFGEPSGKGTNRKNKGGKVNENETLYKNWTVKVGEMAVINYAVAFCASINKTQYCMGMKVKIIAIDKDVCTVETTQEWEDACKKTNSTLEGEKAGSTWIIDLKHLAPISTK